VTRLRVFECFGVSQTRRHVNLFRIGQSTQPARAPRLPVDELIDVL
jgi:hypothetical protein